MSCSQLHSSRTVQCNAISGILPLLFFPLINIFYSFCSWNLAFRGFSLLLRGWFPLRVLFFNALWNNFTAWKFCIFLIINPDFVKVSNFEFVLYLKILKRRHCLKTEEMRKRWKLMSGESTLNSACCWKCCYSISNQCFCSALPDASTK